MSYTKMAFVYDVLMEDAPYEKWEQFADAMFKKFGNNITSVADLGCGTGQVTRRLAKTGYQVLGVDYSEDMLAYAQQAAAEENLLIQWFHQDLRELNGFKNLDAVVSFCDVINYITDLNELEVVFKNVNHMLNSDGLFLFDVHSMDHIENNLKEQTFAEIYDDLSYVWLCQAGESLGEVYHDLTFFVLDEEQYERFDETHHQRTYPINTYRELLKKSGFIMKGLYADFSTKETSYSSDDQRLFFVCQKNSR
ncbi:class I SAM-dependent DNA methyltransferase [Aquibacillus rhizosphaerae]|uniref:Class I SAM-dependent methyltransferase n=1 Tax=Aquibacillus rhizosphaerae TaxID=3051431 RepID=A0ABT7L8G4_9BACI|nr:class I SAM-dependent methyltransferase [Aquibacillus sp. LR5S19]MDL4841475.1 class I SAM-dependent methyltransferase [Aquibacillus sp. LR5S19]